MISLLFDCREMIAHSPCSLAAFQATCKSINMVSIPIVVSALTGGGSTNSPRLKGSLTKTVKWFSTSVMFGIVPILDPDRERDDDSSKRSDDKEETGRCYKNMAFVSLSTEPGHCTTSSHHCSRCICLNKATRARGQCEVSGVSY